MNFLRGQPNLRHRQLHNGCCQPHWRKILRTHTTGALTPKKAQLKEDPCAMAAALLCPEVMTSCKVTTVFVLVVAVADQPHPGGSALSAKGGATMYVPRGRTMGTQSYGK